MYVFQIAHQAGNYAGSYLWSYKVLMINNRQNINISAFGFDESSIDKAKSQVNMVPL